MALEPFEVTVNGILVRTIRVLVVNETHSGAVRPRNPYVGIDGVTDSFAVCAENSVFLVANVRHDEGQQVVATDVRGVIPQRPIFDNDILGFLLRVVRRQEEGGDGDFESCRQGP